MYVDVYVIKHYFKKVFVFLIGTLSTHGNFFPLRCTKKKKKKRSVLYPQICKMYRLQGLRILTTSNPLGCNKYYCGIRCSISVCIPQKIIWNLLSTPAILYIVVNHPHWAASKCFTCNTPRYSIKHWDLQKGVENGGERGGKWNWI